jgi:hypothetical protein
MGRALAAQMTDGNGSRDGERTDRTVAALRRAAQVHQRAARMHDAASRFHAEAEALYLTRDDVQSAEREHGLAERSRLAASRERRLAVADWTTARGVQARSAVSSDPLAGVAWGLGFFK